MLHFTRSQFSCGSRLLRNSATAGNRQANTASPKIGEAPRVTKPLSGFSFIPVGKCEPVTGIEIVSDCCLALREEGRLPGVTKEKTIRVDFYFRSGRFLFLSTVFFPVFTNGGFGGILLLALYFLLAMF